MLYNRHTTNFVIETVYQENCDLFVDFDFWSLIVFLCGGRKGRVMLGIFYFYFWVCVIFCC